MNQWNLAFRWINPATSNNIDKHKYQMWQTFFGPAAWRILHASKPSLSEVILQHIKWFLSAQIFLQVLDNMQRKNKNGWNGKESLQLTCEMIYLTGYNKN